MAWMVRTAVTVASLLHIPQGAEHPVQDSHKFAMFPGPDDDDIKPHPEPDVGEGAVLPWLTLSSPKMSGAAAASPKSSSVQEHQQHGWGQPRDYTSCTSTAYGLGATPAPPPGSVAYPHDPVWGLTPSSLVPLPTKSSPFPVAPVQL